MKRNWILIALGVFAFVVDFALTITAIGQETVVSVATPPMNHAKSERADIVALQKQWQQVLKKLETVSSAEERAFILGKYHGKLEKTIDLPVPEFWGREIFEAGQPNINLAQRRVRHSANSRSVSTVLSSGTWQIEGKERLDQRMLDLISALCEDESHLDKVSIDKNSRSLFIAIYPERLNAFVVRSIDLKTHEIKWIVKVSPVAGTLLHSGIGSNVVSLVATDRNVCVFGASSEAAYFQLLDCNDGRTLGSFQISPSRD